MNKENSYINPKSRIWAITYDLLGRIKSPYQLLSILRGRFPEGHLTIIERKNQFVWSERYAVKVELPYIIRYEDLTEKMGEWNRDLYYVPMRN